MSKKSKIAAQARSEPIIANLQRLAREVAKTSEGRKKLQEYTGLSKAGLETMLYQGRGSPTTWINVFLCVFNLSSNTVLEKLEDLEVSLRKSDRVDPTDKKYFDLTKEMSKDDKTYMLSVWEHAIKLRKKP